MSERVGIVGVDVGGTKVAVARVDGRQAEDPVELPTRRSSVEDVLDDIERAVREAAAGAPALAAIGIGVPSQVDRESGTVVASVNIPLAGVSLADSLRERFDVPVFVDNDANCAALAEAHFTGESPASHLVMYTLGTGVGGGIVIDGSIYRGATGLGAELGHQVIQADGPECPGACPNRGCLEALCSGTALERDARILAARTPESPLGRAAAARNGDLRGRDVVGCARDGDEQSLELFERFGRWLGIGIAGAINTFEPQYVVIGGGLSAAADLFFERACAEARSRALPALSDRVQITLARAGGQAGLIGAGLLAAQELEASGDTAESSE
ncbi:MAG: ROK family protein [Thermoleophilaceae bacterium]